MARLKIFTREVGSRSEARANQRIQKAIKSAGEVFRERQIADCMQYGGGTRSYCVRKVRRSLPTFF